MADEADCPHLAAVTLRHGELRAAAARICGAPRLRLCGIKPGAVALSPQQEATREHLRKLGEGLDAALTHTEASIVASLGTGHPLFASPQV